MIQTDIFMQILQTINAISGFKSKDLLGLAMHEGRSLSRFGWEKLLFPFKSILFWWINSEAFDAKTILFWLVHGWVWRIKSISTSGNTIMFFANVSTCHSYVAYFLLGRLLLTLSWGVTCSEGHTPLKTIFTLENRYFFDEAIVKLLIPSQFCFGWSMVESGISIV